MRVLALLATGFEDLEAFGTIALLRRAKIDVTTCSTENVDTVSGKYELLVKTDLMLKDVVVEDYDAVFLPGGMPGVDNLYNNKKVLDVVLEFSEKNKVLTGICAGPSIYGRLGLLKNKSFTCFPGFEKYGEDGTYISQGVVVDGNVITGRAAGSVHEFAFAIIEKLIGKEKSIEVKENIYYGI